MYNSLSNLSSVERYLLCVQFSANTNKVTMNICFSSNTQNRELIFMQMSQEQALGTEGQACLHCRPSHCTHENLLVFPTATATDVTSVAVATAAVTNLDPGQNPIGGFQWFHIHLFYQPKRVERQLSCCLFCNSPQ